mmetsp:Transcript_26577/g.84308  ORF Transcript_26577/g.84308 Transcript_26577/m.84308 type:complete len:223 (-) Transcript_26577:55-723(-)
MQATHRVVDEEGRPLAAREPASLREHTHFAEDVLGENERLLRDDVADGKSVWHGVLFHTQGCRWVVGVWVVEAAWLVFVTMASCMEAWAACPFDLGLLPVCRHCYSWPFLAWNAALALLWSLLLSLYVLLVSRGYSLRPRARALAEQAAGGAPRSAGEAFQGLCGALLAWLALGALLLAASGSCPRGGQAPTEQSRSGSMFTTTLGSVLLAPVLLFLGQGQL